MKIDITFSQKLILKEALESHKRKTDRDYLKMYRESESDERAKNVLSAWQMDVDNIDEILRELDKIRR